MVGGLPLGGDPEGFQALHLKRILLPPKLGGSEGYRCCQKYYSRRLQESKKWTSHGILLRLLNIPGVFVSSPTENIKGNLKADRAGRMGWALFL
jgi:hypothetical protein